MRVSFVLIMVFAIGVCNQAHAGAWTQKAGEGQLILNSVYYSTTELYNNMGHKTPQNKYRKYEFNPYMEYGLTDAITIGSNLAFQKAEQSSKSNMGVGDSEFFIRARLWQHKGFVISMEPMFKLPSPEASDKSIQLGGKNYDAGLGVSAGYGFLAFGQHHFANIDTQYRHRFGKPQNQIKIASSFGTSISPSWIIMPQVFATYRAEEPSVASFTQSSGDDFDLIKFQISAIYKLNEKMSLQLGGFSHIDGQNVGAGEGILFAIWKRF